MVAVPNGGHSEWRRDEMEAPEWRRPKWRLTQMAAPNRRRQIGGVPKWGPDEKLKIDRKSNLFRQANRHDNHNYDNCRTFYYTTMRHTLDTIPDTSHTVFSYVVKHIFEVKMGQKCQLN